MLSMENKSGQNLIQFCIYSYGIYAFFLLIESIDFLAMLHTPEPGFSPTYNIVHAVFFVVELVVCGFLTLGLLQLYLTKDKKPSTAAIVISGITVFRCFLVYYLYWYSEPEVHFVPYIYKKANEFSGMFRGLFLPMQIIAGLLAAISWIRAACRKPVQQPEAIEQPNSGQITS